MLCQFYRSNRFWTRVTNPDGLYFPGAGLWSNANLSKMYGSNSCLKSPLLAGSSGTNSPGKVFPHPAISISTGGNQINRHR